MTQSQLDRIESQLIGLSKHLGFVTAYGSKDPAVVVQPPAVPIHNPSELIMMPNAHLLINSKCTFPRHLDGSSGNAPELYFPDCLDQDPERSIIHNDGAMEFILDEADGATTVNGSDPRMEVRCYKNDPRTLPVGLSRQERINLYDWLIGETYYFSGEFCIFGAHDNDTNVVFQVHGGDGDSPHWKVVAGKGKIRNQIKTTDTTRSDDRVDVYDDNLIGGVLYPYHGKYDGQRLDLTINGVRHVVEFNRTGTHYFKFGNYGGLNTRVIHRALPQTSPILHKDPLTGIYMPRPEAFA